MVRLLVTSRAYRQTFGSRRRNRSPRDPQNRLFARQGRWRLDAEFIRDAALVISGQLMPRRRRAEREAVPARGLLGVLEFPQADLEGRRRRQSVSPRPVYALAANVLAPQLAGLRRPQPRGMRRRAAGLQYAAECLGAAERSDVCRMCPGCLPSECWRRAVADDASRVRWAWREAALARRARETEMLLSTPKRDPRRDSQPTNRPRRSCLVGGPGADFEPASPLPSWPLGRPSRGRS